MRTLLEFFLFLFFGGGGHERRCQRLQCIQSAEVVLMAMAVVRAEEDVLWDHS